MNKTKVLSTLKEDLLKFPMFIVSHPFRGFDEMKTEKKGKNYVCFIILIAITFLNIMAYLYNGFIINKNNPNNFNSIFTILITIFPYFLFITANWSVTTLMNGSGKYKEIFQLNMYALYPSVFLNTIGIIVSNFAIEQEIPLVMFFFGLGLFTYCFLVFTGLVVVHDFGFGKAILALIATFISMGIMVFILMLLFSLVGEVYNFFSVVINEIILLFK